MKRVKICPECNVEYFPHIEQCADCGAALVLPEEMEKLLEEKRILREKSLDNAVAVREGDLKWIDELYNVLIDSGIPCTVSSDAGCKKSCCGSSYYLLVSPKDTDKANNLIETYFSEVHPEVQESIELASQGKCPACGSPVTPNVTECSDCGLTLVIIE